MTLYQSSSLCCSFLTEDAPSVNTSSQPDRQISTKQALTTLASTPLSATYNSICLLRWQLLKCHPIPLQERAIILLFDDSTQWSFVTQQLADELQLQPTHHETISVSSFGAQVSSSRNLAVASLFVHALNGNHIPISVLIVPELAILIQNSVCTHPRGIPYLQNIPLTHPVISDENFEISVLIRADYYWNFVQDHILRGDGPTAVKSRLGYLLSSLLTLPQSIEATSLHVIILSCTTQHNDMYSFWESGSTGTTLLDGTQMMCFFNTTWTHTSVHGQMELIV